jgi:hypothetical protein
MQNSEPAATRCRMCAPSGGVRRRAASCRVISGVKRFPATEAYRSDTTTIFIRFDEGTGSNQVTTVVVDPSTPSGTRSATPFDHYSLLKTTEELLGIRTQLAHAGDPATHGMRAAFHL